VHTAGVRLAARFMPSVDVMIKRGVIVSRDDSDSPLERFDLHLSELQGVMAAFPVPPHYTRCADSAILVINTIQVGEVTAVVPPATSVRRYA